MFRNYRMIRGIAGGLVVLASPLDARPNPSGEPVAVTAKLSNGRSSYRRRRSVRAGRIQRHELREHPARASRWRGRGLEQETVPAPAGRERHAHAHARARDYEVYCPVGEDSHKKLGMETHLKVVSASGSRAPGDADDQRTRRSTTPPANSPAIQVTGGGPVIQILPGPFPFPDSAGADPQVVRRGARRPGVPGRERALLEQCGADLRHVHVHRVGQGRDPRLGRRTRRVHHPGRARWKVVLDRVQTKDVPITLDSAA